MLCVEDYLDALKWSKDIGGLDALMKRANETLATLEAWADKTPWVDFLAKDKAIRSNTSVCFTIVDEDVAALDAAAQAKFAKALVARLGQRRRCL